MPGTPGVRVPRPLFLLWCGLYIVMGLASLGFGLFLWHEGQKSGSGGVAGVAGVLIVFGLLRIGNTVYVLRRNATRNSSLHKRM